MVRILFAALLISAASASASPALPSFEFSAANLQSTIAAMRASQVKAKAGNIGPQLTNMAWDLERAEREASRLRNDLRWLLQRVRSHQQGNDISRGIVRLSVNPACDRKAKSSAEGITPIGLFLATSATAMPRKPAPEAKPCSK